jgi:fused signal recognition particle receptor
MPPTLAEYLDTAMKRAVILEVRTDDELQAASECLNSLTKGESAAKKFVTEARRPYVEHADKISETVKPVLLAVGEAKLEIGGKIKAYRDMQEAERQRVLAEQRRIAAEAEAKRQAEIREQQRLAAEAQAKAEAARREQERLQWEAQERERLAAEAIMQGQTTQQQVTDNAAALAAAEELDRKAEEARLAAEAAQREAEALANTPAPAPVEVFTAPVPTVTKAKGMKVKEVIEIISTDVSKLAPEYLIADEAKIKRHIKDGVIKPGHPGVEFRVTEMVTGTGR